MILAHDMRLARRTALKLKPSFSTKHGGLAVTAMGSATASDTANDTGGENKSSNDTNGES